MRTGIIPTFFMSTFPVPGKVIYKYLLKRRKGERKKKKEKNDKRVNK